MATVKRQEEWFNGANGRAMNPDNAYGRQCKDVADDYVMYIFGVSWVSTLRPGNANVIFNGSNGDYFDKIANNPNDPNQLPQRGDILCYGGWSGNSAGHILVIESADANGYTGIEQDGFTVKYDAQDRVINQGVPAYRITRNWSWHIGSLQGWLRPKQSRIVGGAPEPTPLAPYQRKLRGDIGKGIVRETPRLNGKEVDRYDAGLTIDFSGWVNGDEVDGTKVWFKGRYRDVYMSAALFEDKGTHDLTDLNPQTPPAEVNKNERVVIDGGLNVRQAPNTKAAILEVLVPGAKITVDSYVKGESVDGNDTWYPYNNGLVWSGGLNSKAIAGLKNVTPAEPTTPIVETPVEAPYTFEKSFDFVTKVYPAAIGNFAYDEFPGDEFGIVLHDFGTPNVNTYGSVIATFTKKGTQVSSHLAFSQANVAQFVDIKDRAYHAGKLGNGYYGFEIDPAFKDDPVQIANVRKAIDALQKLKKKKATLHKHPEFMNTSCGDDIDLSLYDVPYVEEGTPTVPEIPAPQIDPEVPTTPSTPTTPVPADEASKSATTFVTRIASQLAAAAIVVQGVAGLLKTYTGTELDGSLIGWATVLGALGFIAYGQYKYKKTGGEKGWFF